MNLSNFKFTESHEWVRLEGDYAYIGISDYAQGELGDIVFVELPTIGTELKKGDAFGNIEAVKAVSELFSPITGTVVEINENLVDSPELINNSPYDQGWIIKIQVQDKSELDSLMTAEEYESHIKH